MSDSVQREWRFYLDDMIEFVEKVIAYTDGLGSRGFRQKRTELRRDCAQS